MPSTRMHNQNQLHKQISRQETGHNSGLLQKLQSSPQLPALIQKLEPPALHKLIQHIGLKDSGDIIALATTDQIRQVLDIELWKNRKPGTAETLDSDQFLSWLAVWNEIGTDFTATKLYELGDDFLVLCLANVVMVADMSVIGLSDAELDFDNLGITNTDLDPWEAIIPGSALPVCSQDFGNFGVLGSDIDQWDTILSALNSLWSEQPEFMLRVLRRCCFERSILSEDTSENDAKRVLHQDMAQVRESKRERQGFVTPLNASIFLIQAKSSGLEALCAQKEYDLNTRKHFKLATGAQQVENQQLLGHESELDATHTGEEDLRELEKLESVLVDADIIRKSKTPLLLQTPAREEFSIDKSSLQDVLNNLAETNPEALSARLNEIIYMSNILMTGAEFRGGRFLEAEAAKAVMGNCSLGLDYLVSTQPEGKGDTSREHLLSEPGLVQAFQVGYHLINRIPRQCAHKITSALTSIEAENILRQSSPIRTEVDIVLSDGGLIDKVDQGMFKEAKEMIDLLFVVFDHTLCHCLTSLVDSFPCFPMTLDHPDTKTLTVNTSMRYIRSIDDLIVIDHFLDNLTLSL